MKKIFAIWLISLAAVLLFNSNIFAQKDNAEDISIVLPAESIAAFVTRLLPYEINPGENFSGSFFIKSIDNLKIEDKKISFSLHIDAKDMTYAAKLGLQSANIAIGSVDLVNDWECLLRFDGNSKILYIRPHLINPGDTNKTGYREILVNSLFTVFSDIDYPVDLHEIEPVMTELSDKLLIVNFDIADIFAADNKLTIKFRPVPHISDKPKTPADQTP